jgi:hypothetical protein
MDISICLHLLDRGDTRVTGAGYAGFPVMSVVEVADRLMCGAFVENGSVVMPSAVNMPRNAWLHVTGVPIEVFLQAQRMLSADWEENPDRTMRSRRWAFTKLPAAIRNRLLTDRQAAISWNQLRNSVWNLRDDRALADLDLA